MLFRSRKEKTKQNNTKQEEENVNLKKKKGSWVVFKYGIILCFFSQNRGTFFLDKMYDLKKCYVPFSKF